MVGKWDCVGLILGWDVGLPEVDGDIEGNAEGMSLGL